MTISEVVQPITRPACPRTSSAASGLRFCGMIELPVDSVSGSLTKGANGTGHAVIISNKA